MTTLVTQIAHTVRQLVYLIVTLYILIALLMGLEPAYWFVKEIVFGM